MNSGPRLELGARGKDVQRAQTIFVMMKTLDFRDIDGVFGPDTKQAVMDFQDGAGLTVDGIMATRPGVGCPRIPRPQF